MAVVAFADELEKGHVAVETAVCDRQTVVRDLGPEVLDERLLRCRHRARSDCRKEPVREIHERDQPQLRISGVTRTRTPPWLPEVCEVLLGILDAERRPVDAVNGQ